VIAGVIPGQKTDDSALEIMEVTPWWAACKADKISSQRLGGIMILSLYIITPSIV
jgi:hypothetical protein